jgi:hypothetical protein
MHNKITDKDPRNDLGLSPVKVLLQTLSLYQKRRIQSCLLLFSLQQNVR